MEQDNKEQIFSLPLVLRNRLPITCLNLLETNGKNNEFVLVKNVLMRMEETPSSSGG
jgi:hypothetical protein